MNAEFKIKKENVLKAYKLLISTYGCADSLMLCTTLRMLLPEAFKEE